MSSKGPFANEAVNQSGRIDVRVAAITPITNSVNSYRFERAEGGELPATSPGAHIDVALPNGLIRQYSLISAHPSPFFYEVAIKRESNGRGGSNYIHDKVSVGQSLQISRPRNNFPLVENADKSILIAGGIGITPIWCMIQQLHRLNRCWELYYACRSRAEIVFLEALQRYPNRIFTSTTKMMDACWTSSD